MALKVSQKKKKKNDGTKGTKKELRWSEGPELQLTSQLAALTNFYHDQGRMYS